jgi:dTDP-4-dehydrorhamnose 3,5-epimerase
MIKDEKPSFHTGGIAIDDRGSVTFVNDFLLSCFKRFYVLSNHSKGFVRAWHGHKIEKKAFFVSRGTILVSAVKLDDFEKPSKDLHVHRYVLDSRNPKVLEIPAGFANGFKSLTSDSELFVFSNASLEESQRDDFRFPFDYWNPWEIEQR